MTTIEVKEDGTFSADGNPMKVEGLTQEFLERLVDDSLEGTVEYKLEGNMPIEKFFSTLRDGTAEDSELRRLKEESDKKASGIAENVDTGEQDIEGAVPTKDEQDLDALSEIGQ